MTHLVNNLKAKKSQDVGHPADIRIRRISARQNQMFKNYQPPSHTGQ
jgi:hypothetical protein